MVKKSGHMVYVALCQGHRFSLACCITISGFHSHSHWWLKIAAGVPGITFLLGGRKKKEKNACPPFKAKS
jgi:hypothetical protein